MDAVIISMNAFYEAYKKWGNFSKKINDFLFHTEISCSV